MKIKFIQDIIDRIRHKDVFTEYSPKAGVNKLRKELMELKYIYLPSQITHKETFSKYKNIYEGKEIVLVASGPTVRKYRMIKDAIHIGVNHTFSLENLALDYLFAHDSLNNVKAPNLMHLANTYRGQQCKKIYGYHYLGKFGVSETDAMEANAERYYFIDHDIPTEDYPIISADITTRPLNCWSSVVFPAIDFAFYTHPKRIYIVGCDCSDNGHLYWTNKKAFCSDKERIKYGWKQIKKFRDCRYPDVEVVSINPVGLKGLFKDVYTQNYVNEHPELKNEGAEIISEEVLC